MTKLFLVILQLAFQILIVGFISVTSSVTEGATPAERVENLIVNAFRNLVTPGISSRGNVFRGPSGTDAASVNKFLVSRATKYDPTSNSIGGRNQFTDLIDEIDRDSRRPPNVVSRLLSFFDNVNLTI